MGHLEREAFYARARTAFAVVRTGELRAAPGFQVARSVRGVMANLAEGLRYVWQTPVVMLAVVVVGIVSTVGLNLNVLVPVFAQTILHGDAEAFGFMMAATGIGSLVSALAIAFTGLASPRTMLIGAGILGTLEAAMVIVTGLPLALACLFGVGFGSIAMTATANTSIQLAVPDELRGRVMSVYTTVFAGSTPIGALFAGTAAATLGAPAAFFLSGFPCLATAVVAYVMARPWLARRALARAAPQ